MVSFGIFFSEEELAYSEFEFQKIDDVPTMEILNMEKECIGCYVSGNPLDDYKEQISSISHTKISELENCEDGSEIILIARIEKHDSKITRSGKKIHVLNVLDISFNKISNKDVLYIRRIKLLNLISIFVVFNLLVKIF